MIWLVRAILLARLILQVRLNSGAFRRSPLFSHPTHHKPLPTSRRGIHTRVAPLRHRCPAALENTPATIPCTSLIVTECTINMVRYVTLHRYLDEIPPSISFQPHYTSAWRYAKQGFLHVVNTPDPVLWDTAPSKPPNTNFPRQIDSTMQLSE